MDENIKLLGLIEKNRKISAASDAELSSQLAAIANDQYLVNANDGLRKWRLSKAKVDAGIGQILNLNVISDSIGEGKSDLSATAANYEKGWVGRLKSYLNSKYNDVGSGFIGNRFPAGGTSLATYAGTWGTSSGLGWMDSSWAIYSSSSVGDTVTIPFSGTGIVLMAHTASTNPSSVSVSIDGGASVSWDLYKASPSAVTTKSITGLADGAHGCVVTITAGKYQAVGHYSTKGSNGIRTNRLAVGGAKSIMLSNEIHFLSCIDYWSPVLTIIDLIANDYNTQTPLATYTSQLRLIAARAKTFGDVMFVSAGDLYNAAKTIPMSDYKSVMQSVAAEYNCAFLDAGKPLGGTWAIANSCGYLADEVHPTQYGHQDLCTAVIKALGL